MSRTKPADEACGLTRAAESKGDQLEIDYAPLCSALLNCTVARYYCAGCKAPEVEGAGPLLRVWPHPPEGDMPALARQLPTARTEGCGPYGFRDLQFAFFYCALLA